MGEVGVSASQGTGSPGGEATLRLWSPQGQHCAPTLTPRVHAPPPPTVGRGGGTVLLPPQYQQSRGRTKGGEQPGWPGSFPRTHPTSRRRRHSDRVSRATGSTGEGGAEPSRRQGEGAEPPAGARGAQHAAAALPRVIPPVK